MRFVYLTTLYPAYVEQFYKARPGLRLGSYTDQRTALSQDAFGWNGAWREPLTANGHELLEISANVEPLQRAWANENAARWPLASWRTSIALAQCVAFQPNVLLIDDLRNYSSQWLTDLKKRVPSLHVVLGVLGSPSYDWESVRACDAVLAITRVYESAVNARGGRAYFFRHAFNSDSGSNLVVTTHPHAITFCGNIQRGSGYHVDREKFFHDVLPRVPVELYVPQGAISPRKDRVTTFARRVLYVGMQALAYTGMTTASRRRLPIVGKAATWTSMPVPAVDLVLRQHIRGALFGRPMLQKLLESFATVNIHGEAAGEEAVNMRLFEATGVGTCLLTDWKPSLNELFDDDEVVSFRSADEFVERVTWLEDNPGQRDAIAQAGNRRTLRHHTFGNRVGDLLEVVADVLRHKSGRPQIARVHG